MRVYILFLIVCTGLLNLFIFFAFYALEVGRSHVWICLLEYLVTVGRKFISIFFSYYHSSRGKDHIRIQDKMLLIIIVSCLIPASLKSYNLALFPKFRSPVVLITVSRLLNFCFMAFSLFFADQITNIAIFLTDATHVHIFIFILIYNFYCFCCFVFLIHWEDRGLEFCSSLMYGGMVPQREAVGAVNLFSYLMFAISF